MIKRKIEQQKEQRATLAEALRTSETARTENRCREINRLGRLISDELAEALRTSETARR